MIVAQNQTRQFRRSDLNCSIPKRRMSMRGSKIVGAMQIVNYGLREQTGPVVIVGGGPAGLTTALMMAKRGWQQITVLEALSEQAYFDLDRAYPYGVYGRGQKILQYLNLFDNLVDIGIPLKDMPQVAVSPDGVKQTTSIQFLPKYITTPYQISRRDLCKIFFDEIEQYKDSINFNFDCKYLDLTKTEVQKLEVVYKNKDDEEVKVAPQLVVGCDGQNSQIRQKLNEWTGNKKFNVIKCPVLLSGYRFKVLQLPKKFPLDKQNKEKADPLNQYSISGINQAKDFKINLLCNPSSKTLYAEGCRLAFQYAEEDHFLWSLKTGEQILKYLEEQLPQLPIREMITLQEAERFAQSKGGRFPFASYCLNTSFLLQKEEEQGQKVDSSEVGIVLVGDAFHAFPPTIGQGLNAALEDVMILNEMLEKHNSNLSKALLEYEKLRVEDAKALIELTKLGTIFSKFTLPATFRFISFFVKDKLYKILPIVFPPPAVVYYADENYRYSEALNLKQQSNIVYTLYLSLAVIASVFSILQLKQ